MTHVFKSLAPQIILWCLIVFIIILDMVGLWTIFVNKAPVAFFMKFIMLIGVCLKFFILGCLLTKKGPVKFLLNIWGFMFVVSGVFGLMVFMMSPTIEPIQAYLDKLIFLSMGGVIIYISKEKIEYVDEHEN